MNILQKIKKIKVSKGVVALVLVLLIFGFLTPIDSVLAEPGNPINIDQNPTYTNPCKDGEVAVGIPPNHTCRPARGSTSNQQSPPTGGDIYEKMLEPIAKFIASVLITVSSFVLMLAGTFFDFVVTKTIVDMGQNLASSNSEGLGGSIREAWITLRDISNMFFIFVLLITAFKTMFSLNFGNTGRAILNIVIVALLINFSLFFTKVVIDASNIVAVGFYNSIVSSGAPPAGAPTEASTSGGTQKTITGGYMRMIGISSWLGVKTLNSVGVDSGQKILVTGIMSSVFFLITAVVFMISGVMFLARFLILIFLMILSPAALVAIIIPGMKDKFETWKNAVIDQSIFAPVFFALTWVVFKLGNAPKFLDRAALVGDGGFARITTEIPTPSTTALVFNYFLLIGMAIMALVVAKQIASKTAYFSALSGGIGAGILGTTAFAGRQFLGRGGEFIASKMQAAKGSENFAKRTGARLLSYAGEKAAKSSFDARNATIPTSVVGDAIRGTIGKTAFGKKIGLDDVNIQSIDIGNRLSGGIAGTAEKKGYRELKLESSKRVREREAAETSQIKLAQAKNNILKGSSADSSTIQGQTAIGEMEKSLASLSEKETETLVASNRELLKSQNFANAISVKQLEAIVKSDQFSEDEKSRIKNARFAEISDINDADGLLAIKRRSRGATLTPAEIAAATKVEKARTRVKSLTDSELEMVDASYLNPTRPEGVEFIGQLKGNQVDAINKSSKFTSSQKENIRRERIRPLMDALRTGRSLDAQNIVRKADIKTKVGYMRPIGVPPVVIATHPDILPIYTVKMLQRMAVHDDMTDDDIRNLRLAILASPRANPNTINWLNDPDKGMVEFPP